MPVTVGEYDSWGLSSETSLFPSTCQIPVRWKVIPLGLLAEVVPAQAPGHIPGFPVRAAAGWGTRRVPETRGLPQ